MKNAWAIKILDEEVLNTSVQLGVKDIVVYGGPGFRFLPGTEIKLNKPRATLEDYKKLVNRVDSYGLKIAAIEGGIGCYPKYRDLLLGGPKRDEIIEELIDEIRDIARAGIPVLGYHWMLNCVWRSEDIKIRGDSKARYFNLNTDNFQPMKHYPIEHEFSPDDSNITSEDLWRNLEYWIKAITPVAEEEGIKLGIHPDDPPVGSINGVPRILSSFDSYKRLIDIYPSDANGIEFCQGTFSEMNEDIYEMIEYFAKRNKILYVHFRNVSSQLPSFSEEFINNGYVDMYKAMKIYNKYGYEGVFMDDHCPLIDNDIDFPGNWGGYRSRIFAQGYIQAMIESVKKS
jgi:mannonate dehydratase